jgi:hypothetical protein
MALSELRKQELKLPRLTKSKEEGAGIRMQVF